AEALLGFLFALRCGDDRTHPPAGNRGDDVDQIALAGSRSVSTYQIHWRRRQRAAHQRGEQAGDCDRAITWLSERELGEQVGQELESRLCRFTGGYGHDQLVESE